MPWWGWILVGAILLGSELFVTTEFYLVFLGLAALAVGVCAMLLDLSAWQQWLGFAVLALVFLVGFRGRLFRLLTTPRDPVRDRMLGELATSREAIAPGATGSAELRGSVWSARNAGDAALAPGDKARVVGIDGLTLEVRREP